MAPLFILGCCLATILFTFSILIISQTTLFFFKRNNNNNLPPGSMGWPIIGESVSFHASARDFIRHRMTKYSTSIFKTSFLGLNVIFLEGPEANKFIFANEGKLFKWWLPAPWYDLLSLPNYPENSDSHSSWLLLDQPIHKFFKLDSLRNYVSVIDSMTRENMDHYWGPNNNNNHNHEVDNFAKEYTLNLACRVMLDYSNSNPEQIRVLAKQFLVLADGIFTSVAVPVNLPGLPYYRAKRRADKIREMVMDMVKQRRRKADDDGSLSSTSSEDLLGILVQATHPDGQVFSDKDIVSKIIGYVFAGFYTSGSIIPRLVTHLAQHPLIFQKLKQEQLEIIGEQGGGGGKGKVRLCWEDVQKMKYSWNFIREALRLLPPESVMFREAITDFTYQGYTIPKGWKMAWTPNSTHTNPKYFKDPEKFDPSRFEEEVAAPYTYVPFSGGLRMCKGNELARISLLVFLHNVVTKFKLEEIHPQHNTPCI